MTKKVVLKLICTKEVVKKNFLSEREARNFLFNFIGKLTPFCILSKQGEPKEAYINDYKFNIYYSNIDEHYYLGW